MLNRTLVYVSVGLVFILAFSACAVKKMTKQARQFEAARMFKEASGMYYEVLLKKPGKTEIQIALKRSGQIYLEELSAEVKQSFNRGQYKECVYQYLEASELQSKAKRVGVNLKPDPAMDRYYNDAKDYYLEERYNKGLRFITDQNFREAETIFSEIYTIEPDYKDTRSYLNQATFEPIYREGSQLFIAGNYMQAYDKWERIYSREKNYKDVKERMNQALMERYKQGTLLLMNEDFQNAATALGEVYRVNPNFEDVKVQYIEARNEPVYRQANIEMDRGKCRTAYFDFDRIIQDAGTYKNSKALKDQALKCAQYPIAIYSPPIKNAKADAAQFENTLLKSLLNKNNIFLKIYDLTTLNSRTESRLMSSSGKIDAASLKELNQKNGIKAVLILDYDAYIKNEGKMQKESKPGFERIVAEGKDGVRSIYDKEITYYTFAQQNAVSLNVSYKLVSATTGEIMISNRYRDAQDDEVYFATYDGDQNILFPATGSIGKYNVDEGGYKRLQALLNAETGIKSMEYLQSVLFNNLAGEIASDINNFNPER